ncbi:hypothetical protein VST7929_00957 [Vibrio stylophorae]|uniref:Glycosyltransferase subfamily 4-like N-terminal domain-containing protein n=1 Tax=Vibrio stylophorae TaxID=659351 RepID=A0ABN8DSB4_9VIBR|nr:glycosyltransferase family 4 protein [Vibrio stylophorae]CAH0533104.1 hypothetical protein VST7929_00957 [Vibrio stylophorae]
MKKTIGIVVNEFPVLSETFVGNEMRALMRQGHSVVPLSLHQPSGKHQPQDEFLAKQTRYLEQAPKTPLKPLLGLLAWPQLKSLVPFLHRQQGWSAFALLRQGARIAHLAKASGCQHLHAHFAWASAASAIVAAKLLGISVSFTGHGADVYANAEDLPAKCQAADWVCAVTHAMERDLQQYGCDTFYHPCGLDLSRFHPIPQALGAQPHFLFFGRIVEKKGLDLLLQAFHQLAGQYQEVQLDVVGDGPLKAQLENEYAHPRIRFLGAQPQSWLLAHAASYGALVMPFRIGRNGDQDTGPLIIKEAMALGLPVITTHLIGCDEILGPSPSLERSCAVQVEMEDRSALTDMMIAHLFRTHESLQAQRQRAEQRVRSQFDIDTLAARFSHRIQIAGASTAT